MIDIGCGKGALLWVFSKYAFGQIAGLEYSKALCEICSENMKKLDLNVDIINGDANFYNDYDRYNYMYLYNPFQGAIMTNFINNLHECIVRSSRKIRIIYKSCLSRRFFEKWLSGGRGICDRYLFQGEGGCPD